MGGMAAQIPIKDDPKANDEAMAKVKADKLREVLAGHDGTWIAHPLINKIAREAFDSHMLGPNQVRLSSQKLERLLTSIPVPRLARGCQGHRQQLARHQGARQDY